MGDDRRSHNKDYYNVGGRSPGPAGPLGQFKSQLSKGKAVLRRDEEHKLPGERPLSGKREGRGARVHGEHHSVLERLPKPVGAAGVPQSMKAVAGAPAEGRAEEEEPLAEAYERAPEEFSMRLEGEETELSPAAAPPLLETAPDESRLSPMARRMVRTFPLLFRTLGDAARAIDEPIKRTLGRLQYLGEASRKPS